MLTIITCIVCKPDWTCRIHRSELELVMTALMLHPCHKSKQMRDSRDEV